MNYYEVEEVTTLIQLNMLTPLGHHVQGEQFPGKIKTR